LRFQVQEIDEFQVSETLGWNCLFLKSILLVGMGHSCSWGRVMAWFLWLSVFSCGFLSAPQILWLVGAVFCFWGGLGVFARCDRAGGWVSSGRSTSGKAVLRRAALRRWHPLWGCLRYPWGHFHSGYAAAAWSAEP